MGFFDQPFVADAAEANHGVGKYTPLPEGEYDLIIEAAELTKSKANCELAKLTFKVTKGEHEDTKIFKYLNLENPNPQAVDIAKRELHALLIMIGVKQVEHVDDLQGHTFRAKVTVKSYNDKNGEKKFNNEVILSVEKGATAPTTNAVPTETKGTTPRAAPKGSW